MTGMFDPAIGKVTMRATIEWFKKEELHEYTLMLHTHAEEKRVRVRQMWVRAGWDRMNST